MKTNISGLFFEHSGYGKMAREYAISLYNWGLDLGMITLGSMDLDGLGLSKEKHKIMSAIKQNMIYDDYPLIIFYMPEMYPRLSRNIYNIGYCELETTRLPKHWVDPCNSMNEIWVPSKHMYDIAIESGVKTPMHIIPQGIDIDEFKPGPGIDLPDEIKKTYKFFVNGEFIERKKIAFVVDAFCDAFDGRDDVSLIIKTYDLSDINYKVNIPKKLKAIKGKRKANIYLLNNFIKDSMMPRIYNAIDCVIHASAGEGWSFIPFETLCCNKKLIMQPWGPTAEYIPSEYYKAISYRMEDVPMQGIPNDKVFAGSQWAKPSKQSLIAHMKAQVGDTREVDSRSVVSFYNWKMAGKKIVDRLYELKEPKYIVKNQCEFDNQVNMICPSWGLKCGISTYTNDLIKELSKTTTVIVNAPTEGDIKTVHIQFQYGLYRYDKLQILFEKLQSLGKRIVLTMHDFDYTNKQSIICNELIRQYVDTIIVHSKLQADTMKQYGFNNGYDKIFIIPHGIDAAMKAKPAPKIKYDIGFFGFSYSHKGLIELGYAIKMLNVCKDTKALMLTTTGVNIDSKEYVAKVADIFNREGISNYVTFKQSFLEKQRIIELLSECEFLVFPYEDYGNIGISGALRVAMLAMRPLIFTDTPFFSDIEIGTRIKDNRPQTIADAVMNSKHSIEGQSDYIDRCSWDNTAMLHTEIYKYE